MTATTLQPGVELTTEHSASHYGTDGPMNDLPGNPTLPPGCLAGDLDQEETEILCDYDSFYGNVMPEIRAQLAACGSAEALCSQLHAELDDEHEPHDYTALAEWCRSLV